MIKCEYILDKGDKKFNTTYGTTLMEDSPSVVYLRTKVKATSLDRSKTRDDEEEANEIQRDFTAFVRRTVEASKIVGNDYLFNIEMPIYSFRYGKVSNVRFDLYLKPLKRKPLGKHLFRMTQLSKKIDRGLSEILSRHDVEIR